MFLLCFYLERRPNDGFSAFECLFLFLNFFFYKVIVFSLKGFFTFFGFPFQTFFLSFLYWYMAFYVETRFLIYVCAFGIMSPVIKAWFWLLGITGPINRWTKCDGLLVMTTTLTIYNLHIPNYIIL